MSHLFWDRVHVFFSFGRICIFVRVFISDYFSLVFKDFLFGFYSSHKNLKDKYFLISLFIFLAKLDESYHTLHRNRGESDRTAS